MKNDRAKMTARTNHENGHGTGHGNEGGTMSMRTFNTASDAFWSREADSNDAAGKRAVAIQALIVSRRLRVRARLARRAVPGRDTGRPGMRPPATPLTGAPLTGVPRTGAAVPEAADAGVPGTGR